MRIVRFKKQNKTELLVLETKPNYKLWLRHNAKRTAATLSHSTRLQLLGDSAADLRELVGFAS